LVVSQVSSPGKRMLRSTSAAPDRSVPPPSSSTEELLYRHATRRTLGEHTETSMSMKFFSRIPSVGRGHEHTIGQPNTEPLNTTTQADLGGRVFDLKPGLMPGSMVENVLVDGRAQGYVMSRSPHYVVWSERSDRVHVQGDNLPWACVARMWEGPRGAAISEDELWCVVIGLGFIAFPLRPGREMRSHWRHPFHERWQLHQPMTGDLVDAVLFTGVRALSAHRFALSTRWGLGNAWTMREWIYDADTDTIAEPRDIIDEAKRRASLRPKVSAAYAEERQLAAALRGDGAESTAEAGTTFELDPHGGERVLAKGKPIGTVLCRTSRFVVWQELGSMVCAEGETLPWLLLDDMYGGARAAAISPDEEWCVVVGCGFRVRHLRLAGVFRTHGADPGNILWLDEVEALGEHKFRLRGGAAGTVNQYVYDADSDELRLEAGESITPSD
jgi:hypothetical protein